MTEPSPPGVVARTVASSRAAAEKASARLLGAREQHLSVDVGFRVADRDKRVAAGVLAGGVAYRFFFWVLAFSLLTGGALGFVDESDVHKVLESQGVDPGVVKALESSVQTSQPARWWLILLGSWLLLWTGYLGAKALVLVHATVWNVPPRRVRNALLASVCFTGTALAFASSLLLTRWLRDEAPRLGVVATVAAILVPFGIWLVVSRSFPPGDLTWQGAVPGAAVVAIGVEGLHLFTVYYLLPTLDSTTQLYGVLGIVSTVLFWFYILGRLMIGGATLTAILDDRPSQFVMRHGPR